MEDKIRFIDFFKEIPGHRLDRRKLHSVEEVLHMPFVERFRIF